MRAVLLLVWAAVALSCCCCLVCAGEDTKEKDRGSVQVRPDRSGRPGEMELSDKPAEEVEEEQTKAKKKKTPEEIEAGM